MKRPNKKNKAEPLYSDEIIQSAISKPRSVCIGSFSLIYVCLYDLEANCYVFQRAEYIAISNMLLGERINNVYYHAVHNVCERLLEQETER